MLLAWRPDYQDLFVVIVVVVCGQSDVVGSSFGSINMLPFHFNRISLLSPFKLHKSDHNHCFCHYFYLNYPRNLLAQSFDVCRRRRKRFTLLLDITIFVHSLTLYVADWRITTRVRSTQYKEGRKWACTSEGFISTHELGFARFTC